jgi:hypothetical protein
MRGSGDKPAHLRSKSRHIVPQMAWLSEIGNQLRDEYTVVKQAESMPEQLAALLSRFEAGERPPEPPAVRLATINAVMRASVVSRPRSPAAVPIPSEEPSRPRHQSRPERVSPDVSARSRRATALGGFEKLVLDMFDNHLRGPERDSAGRKFTAYIRVCHAMLDLGLITESELAGE